MSSPQSFSGDASSDLKAEIINRSHPTQTNTHTHREVSSIGHAAYAAEQDVYDGIVECD